MDSGATLRLVEKQISRHLGVTDQIHDNDLLSARSEVDFAKHFEFEKPYMVILEHGKKDPGLNSPVARRAHNAPNVNRLCRIQTT
jgi:hypothetical protein